MRNLLGTLAILLILLAVIGYSRDWFSVSRQSGGSETDVHIQIDRDRIRTDTQNAARVAGEIKDNIKKKIADRQADREQRETR